MGSSVRIGHGYDVHPLVEGRPLILGGVRIDSPRGLAGHSDADVLTHAIASALLGSLALGDLGTHFPDTDLRWRGASSLELLAAVYAMVKERGYVLGNCDATIVAQQPRLAGFVAAMRANLASVLEVDSDAISVKATTHEGLGAVGRGEGIVAQAVVTIVFVA
jgi:2-C-methyl-D-erythritol 2,4-cyclodiphosphate synthase